MSIIDSRELQDEINDLQAQENEPDGLEAEEQDRLNALVALADEVGGEWEYGAALIPEGEFEDHARDLAEETGAIPSEYTWPISCIDWEQAARELSMDYTTVELEGVTYYVRP